MSSVSKVVEVLEDLLGGGGLGAGARTERERGDTDQLSVVNPRPPQSLIEHQAQVRRKEDVVAISAQSIVGLGQGRKAAVRAVTHHEAGGAQGGGKELCQIKVALRSKDVIRDDGGVRHTLDQTELSAVAEAGHLWTNGSRAPGPDLSQMYRKSKSIVVVLNTTF